MKIIYIISITLYCILISCSSDESDYKDQSFLGEDAAHSPEKDQYIQRYNINQMKKFSGERFDCDTIALMEFVLNNFPEGSYLVETDKASPYSMPRPAVIYYNKNSKYVFGIVAKSKEGERLIETKNIIGYDQSFIDLDSTELGTAFFYLTLFYCNSKSFEVIWESPIPSHGGFNNLIFKLWNKNNLQYIQVNFHYAQGIGHINYNYFLVEGLTNKPHLLMTYKGINFKRTLANVNGDVYPDYYEHIYYDLGDRIYSNDSVAFVWSEKRNAYINTRNSKQTRRY